MNEDQPNKSTSTNQSKPSRPTRWALLFPIALLALVVFLNSRAPEPQNDSPLNTSSMTPAADDGPPATNAAEASATAASRPVRRTPQKAEQVSTPQQILVPGDDALLHPKPFKPSGVGGPMEVRRDSLNAIIKAAPDLFPDKAQVKSVQHDSAKKRIVVSVNSAFADDSFWNKSEKITELAVYALVNSVARMNEPKGEETPVQIVVEDKPGDVLGQFDISEPIEANWQLMAKGS